MILLFVLFWCRWYNLSDLVPSHSRRCEHRQCEHCLELEVDLQHPEDAWPWWTEANAKVGKLARG